MIEKVEQEYQPIGCIDVLEHVDAPRGRLGDIAQIVDEGIPFSEDRRPVEGDETLPGPDSFEMVIDRQGETIGVKYSSDFS